jgi:uncharacterized protein (TIRG00374 family)
MNEDKEIKKPSFGTFRLLLPLIFGIGYFLYKFLGEFDPGAFEIMHFTYKTLFFLFIALFFMILRDVGYIVRLKILSDDKFTWKQAFRVIMLWEFTSAVTPSAIGGTSIAIIYVNKEGLNLGRSTAVVMATSFLDELYFIIMFPLLLLIVGSSDLFTVGHEAGSLSYSFMWFAFLGYGVKFLFTMVIVYGLFVNPRGLKKLLYNIFSLRLLKKWRHRATLVGSELMATSEVYKGKSISFWIKAVLSSFVSWTSRYWVVNAILVAFFIVDEHFLIFARQLVMWIMMLVSPTPGGSGFAEFVFTEYLGEFIPGNPAMVGSIAVTLALVWRLFSYYPYLLIGAIMLPKWVKDKF